MMSTDELAVAVGVSQRKVLSWIEHGYFIKPANGHGSKRRWTQEELRIARLIPGMEFCLRVPIIKIIRKEYNG